MKFINKQMRDINIIEKLLHENKIGILAYYDNKYKVNQLATAFYYLDKNIYMFFEEDNECFGQITFENQVNFSVTILNSSEEDKYSSCTQIKCNGTIKKIEDTKVVNDILMGLKEKYAVPAEIKKSKKIKCHCVKIDTEDIQGYEISLEK